MEQTLAVCWLGAMEEGIAESGAGIEGWRNKELEIKFELFRFERCSLLTPYASAQTLSEQGGKRNEDAGMTEHFIH